MIEVVFWISLFLISYSFIGYPLLLKLIVIINKHREIQSNSNDTDFTSFVSIILSVYNEENVIKKKINNFFELDYPKNLIELIIISDGSTDNTENIIKSFNSERIKLVVQKKRSGKTMALNKGVLISEGDILVFTDANSMFDKCAIKKLIRHFRDPLIGLVTGKIIYFNFADGKKETISGLYQRYEEILRGEESKVASIVGADGAIYAFRKKLYEPLRSEYINDLTHPIQTVLKGYKAVLDSEAICMEEIDSPYEGEFKRQTRIMSQAFLVYISYIGKLLSNKKWLYAWELTSHKLLRWLSLLWMTGLFFTTIILFKSGLIFQSLLILQITFLLLIVSGAYSNIEFLKFPYCFFLIHLASLAGIYNFLLGKTFVTWEPRKN
ncbi:MAG: glycosyltransferase family 2 protein [Nitrospirota bacterium]